MPTLREGLESAVAALGSVAQESTEPPLGAALRLVYDEVARARGLELPEAWRPTIEAGGARTALAPWGEPGAAEQLGEVYQRLLTGRRGSGSFYTPAALVAWILDRTLDPALPESSGQLPQVLDPTCGTGHVLVPAARRMAERLGRPLSQVVAAVHGLDLDPCAVEITRFLLWLEDPTTAYDVLVSRIRVGNALLVDWATGAPDVVDGFDVIVGNPPFLNQLRRGSVRGRDESAALRTGGQVGAYTDTSAVILARAVDRLGPGGRVGLVQPLSMLGARDASPLRASVAQAGAVVDFWATDVPVFDDAAVLTCVPVIERGRDQSSIQTWHGPRFVATGEVPAGELTGEWGHLVASGLGVPTVSLPEGSGVLGDLSRSTADFRDQYYGLVDHVREADGGAPGPDQARLITTGLIDPAHCRWGRHETRFAKRLFAAPVVDLAALRAQGDLADWAESRLVPKVLVATQGRVIEAVADVEGTWLPSVPTITVTASPERLWHVLAVLLAPPISATAAARYAGTGFSPRAIKLSAKQVAALPLPRDREAWEEGARIAEQAQAAADDHVRAERLQSLARVMCAAYGDDAALGWWLERARLVSRVEENTSHQRA